MPYWGTYDDTGSGRDYADPDDDVSELVISPAAWHEKYRPSWLSNTALAIIVIILFLLGLGFLIAGSIMLGIGVSKSHTKQPTCPSITASPYYATVESTKITYADVTANYANAASVVEDQVRSALTSSNSKSAMFATAANDPYITVLGLSPSNKGVMAVVGMAYTSADAPSSTTLETDLDQGNQMSLYHVSNDTASTSDTQMCNTVSSYQQPPPSNNHTTPTSTTSTSSTSTKPTTSSSTSATIPTSSSSSTVTTSSSSSSTSTTMLPQSSSTSPPPTSSSSSSSTSSPGLTSSSSSPKSTSTQSPTTSSTPKSSTASKKTTSSLGPTQSTSPGVTTSTTPFHSTSTGPTTVSSRSTSGSQSASPNSSTVSSASPSTVSMTTSSQCVCPTDLSGTTLSSTVGSSPSTQAVRSTTRRTSSGTTSSIFTSMKSTPPWSTSTIPSTSAVPTTTATQPPPVTTACQPVTPPPRPGAKDVVVLIDDSTAVGSATNYNQITAWLANTLFPQWPITTEKWEAAPAQYAQYQFTLLMDFDANSVNELATIVKNSVYIGKNSPSITKGLKSTLGLIGRAGVHRVILLISTSSNMTDLETALPLAEQAKNQGNDIITMALGGSDGSTLGILSSGPSYTFSSNGFAPSTDQATQITNLIQGGSLTTAFPTTTLRSTNPPITIPLVDFPCKPDIAVVVDSSGAVGSQPEYVRQLAFISDQLGPSWSISPKTVETEIIVHSVFGSFYDAENAFNYLSYQDFSTAVRQYDPYWSQFSPPSISGSLDFLVSTIANRRPGRTPTTVLFTYSGNLDDVIAARNDLPSLGNLIVIGMGQDNQNLNLLSGNLITGVDYGTPLLQKINSFLCSPSSPAPLPTTQSTTTVKSSSLPTTTTPTTTMGTTVALQHCPDCNPGEANILMAMDSSSLMKSGQLNTLKAFINNQLTANWTHPERLAVLGFDDKSHFFSPVDFGDINTMSEFHQLITADPQLPNPPSLTSAFQLACSNFHPIPKFGSQKSVIFTISADPQDIQTAQPWATILNKRGIVVLVGMNMTDVSALRSLAPSAISWPNLNDSTAISDQIMQGLTGAFLNYTTIPMTTTSPSGSSQTTPGSTSSTVTTTAGTTTLFSASPAICSRDVILLIDESNAFPNQDSFNQLKTWVMKTLIPLWEINPKHIAVAPYGFANRVFNDLGGDFLALSQSELQQEIQENLQYQKNVDPNVHSAVIKAANITTRAGAATILISASDSASDINLGLDAAKQLKSNGGTVITLFVGPNYNGQLAKLSSGLDFQFFSTQFSVSNEIAMDISDVLCSSAPTTTPLLTSSPQPTTTTTQPPPPFSCTPDVAFMFDSSSLNSNASLFETTVNYVADSLIANWIVDSQHVEATIIWGNVILASSDFTPWRYRDREELAEALHQMSESFFGAGPGIQIMFDKLAELSQNRRETDPLTAILFTFSSDPSEVVASSLIVSQLNANVISIGMGSSDPGVLGLLSGNVETGMALGDQLTNWINAAVCNPKSPIATVPPTVTTNLPTSTTPTSSPSTTSTTTVIPTTTTVLPEGCPDCYPSLENILILVDNSAAMTNSTFNEEKLAILNLVSNWTHLERVALGDYSSSLEVPIFYDTLAKNALNELQLIISNIQQSKNQPDLGNSLRQATGIGPNPIYGIQKTVLFTSSSTVNDKANQSGANLRAKGQLIVVGIGMVDVTALTALASPGSTLPWPDVTDTNAIVQQVLALLGSEVSTYTPGSSTQSSTLLPTTSSTTQGPTTTLPANVINCAKDVLLLIDDSNAYGNGANFNATKAWIVNSLVPTWNVNPSRIAVLPAGYANKQWNNIANGDFGDILSVSELQLMLTDQLYFLRSTDPSIYYGLQKALSVAKPQTVTVLISASEDPNDINNAYQSAMKLKEYGGAVITLSLGPKSQNLLSLLSSGKNYSFVSTDYAISPALANSISSLICGDEPLFTTTIPLTTTFLPTTTVTSSPPPFSCTPDVAFLFDSSNVNSNDSILQNTVNYVADNLISNWKINPGYVEAAMIFATSAIGLSDPNPWMYRDVPNLQAMLHEMGSGGTYLGDPSVTGLLAHLESVAQTRRNKLRLIGILFTFSTDYADVVNALQIQDDIDVTIIAVGLGSSDYNTLGLLTGNVIIPSALDDQLTAYINNVVCYARPPFKTPTTSVAPITTTNKPSTRPTTVTIPTTTVAPEGCPDCYPSLANLLIVLDNSINQTAITFADQKQAVLNLVSAWNHFERVALASFADKFEIIMPYTDITNLATFQILVQNLQQTHKAADLGGALLKASSVTPLPLFGLQQTILFTTTVDNSQKAQTSASTLQKEGQLVMVGVAMANVSGFQGLASPGAAIAWVNVNDTQGVADSIMGVLGATSKPTVGSTSSRLTTTSLTSTTSGTTTVKGTTCPNDLILLLDDSTAIPGANNFTTLKIWVTGTFLAALQPSVNVYAYGYDTKYFQDLTGGFLPANIAAVPINAQYSLSSFGPNISKALQKADGIVAPDGTVSTFLVSASSDPNDVNSAGQYAYKLKTKGEVITLLVGSLDQGLTPLASEPDMSFASKTFAPDAGMLTQILGAICSNESPLPTTSVSTTQSSTRTSSTTTTRLLSTTTAPTAVTSTTVITKSTSIRTTVTVPTTTITPEGCPDCFPSIANLLLILDTSSNQTDATFADQKLAVLNLTSTWNHFERVALATFADKFEKVMDYTDITDFATLQILIQTMAKTAKPADLANALNKATSVTPLPLFGLQQTILFTTTVDNSQKAQTSASTLQKEGQLVMVGVAMADASGFQGLASPGAAIAWVNVNDTQGVADSIMGTIGATSKPTAGPTTSTITTSSVQSVRSSSSAGTTIAAGTSCPKDLILLLDDSNAFGSFANFGMLANWISTKFLVNLPNSIRINANSYDLNSFNQLTGGSFLPADLVNLTLRSYANTPHPPSITHGLKYADSLEAVDGTLSTLLISAQSNSSDVDSAGDFAYIMKEKGSLLTLLVGKTGDGLLPLSSGPTYSFSSAAYSPSDDLLTALIASICSNPGTLPPLSTTGAPSTFTTITPSVSTSLPSTSTITTTNSPSTSSTTVTTSSSSSRKSTTPRLTTTITTEKCPDCYPAMANLLILFDNSNNQTAATYANQKLTINYLFSNWTHFERFDMAPYSSSLNEILTYNEFDSATTAQRILNITDQVPQSANLGKSLYGATGIQPIADFGLQRTIVFTTTVDNSDRANSSAQTLRNEGQLVMVGVGMTDVSALQGLASPGGAIAWPDTSDIQGVVNNILTAIGATEMSFSSIMPTTTGVQTSGPTTTSIPSTTPPPYIPTKADILIAFDVSSSIASSESDNLLYAEKNLMYLVMSNWTYAQRVAVMSYSTTHFMAASFNQFNDFQTVQTFIDTVTYKGGSQNMTGAFEYIVEEYGPVGDMTTRNVVFFTGSKDATQIANSKALAKTVQQLGRLIVVGVGLADVSPLADIASPNSTISFSSNYNDPSQTAALINELLM